MVAGVTVIVDILESRFSLSLEKLTCNSSCSASASSEVAGEAAVPGVVSVFKRYRWIWCYVFHRFLCLCSTWLSFVWNSGQRLQFIWNCRVSSVIIFWHFFDLFFFACIKTDVKACIPLFQQFCIAIFSMILFQRQK